MTSNSGFNENNDVLDVFYDTNYEYMDQYDRLPKEIREYIANYPFNVIIDPDRINGIIAFYGMKYFLNYLKSDDEDILRKAATLAYGHAHPEANPKQ